MSLDDDSIDLDLIAASLRADASDLHAFMEVIGTKLETALPAATQVRRGRRGFRGPKVVEEVAVQTGGERLELRRNGDSIDAVRARLSGGIVLRTERLEIDAWLGALTEVLAESARRSSQTRQALAQLLDT